jgi:hypothetical protein
MEDMIMSGKSRCKFLFVFFLVLISLLLINARAFAKGGYSKGPSPESNESYSPYQNPVELPESKTKHFSPPQTIDKGDYYIVSKGRRINLLRLRDQVAVTGDAEVIERIIDEALASAKLDGKKNFKKKFNRTKIYRQDTHLCGFEDVEEADLASELITELKNRSEVPFVSPVFYNKKSGLRMVLMNEISVKLKKGYTISDLLTINLPYIQMNEIVELHQFTILQD